MRFPESVMTTLSSEDMNRYNRQLILPEIGVQGQMKLKQARVLIAVGRFAETRAREALAGMEVVVGCVPHPSPANPGANKGWARLMDQALADLGPSPTALPCLDTVCPDGPGRK